jgi:ankyrin repeat protein
LVGGAACWIALACAGAQEGRLGPESPLDAPVAPARAPRSAGQAALIDFVPYSSGANQVELGRLALAPPALITAAKGDDVGALRRLLESGVPVNLGDAAGDTALMHAVRAHNIEVVRVLLEHGANPNLRGGDGLTPLMVTVLADDRWMARLLVRQGADPDGRDAGGQRPLFAAIRYARDAVAAELLHAGADLSLENSDLQSALVYAIVEGRTEVVRQMVQGRSHLNREDEEGRTPLYWALFFKRMDEARILAAAGGRLGAQKIELPAELATGVPVPGKEPGAARNSSTGPAGEAGRMRAAGSDNAAH